MFLFFLSWNVNDYKLSIILLTINLCVIIYKFNEFSYNIKNSKYISSHIFYII